MLKIGDKIYLSWKSEWDVVKKLYHKEGYNSFSTEKNYFFNCDNDFNTHHYITLKQFRKNKLNKITQNEF